jgi:prevent-host-death family protein
MSDPVFSDDVRPITDFKVKSSAIVEHARRTRRPVLITQRGRGVAVVVALEEFERMTEELAFGRAVDEGAEQARRRQFVAPSDVDAVLGKRRRWSVRVRWTRLALADLVAARDHLAAENIVAAAEMLRAVAGAIRSLRRHPRMGRVVPERRSLGYRELILPPYRLVYAITSVEIQVLRFWHARRDPRQI